MKLRHEFMFYALMALVLAFAPKAHAIDSLEIHSGDQAIRWTGDLLTLRWGTHQIEFDAETQDNWTDSDGIFTSGADEDWEFWTIDVQYNHRIMHIPMWCSVTVYSHLGQYDVHARCRGE